MMSDQEAQIREEEEISRHPDPVAKARAAKAAKAAAKAAAEAEAAEREANAARLSDDGNPRVSGRARPVQAFSDDGEPIEVRVTYKGHGQISSGEDFGFERFGRNAKLMMPERSARANYEKGWIEPTDERFVDKWEREAARERIAGARAKREFEDVLAHGSASDYSSHGSFGGLAPR